MGAFLFSALGLDQAYLNNIIMSSIIFQEAERQLDKVGEERAGRTLKSLLLNRLHMGLNVV